MLHQCLVDADAIKNRILYQVETIIPLLRGAPQLSCCSISEGVYKMMFPKFDFKF